MIDFKTQGRSILKKVKAILLVGILCAFFTTVTIGCQNEGPAEKAGKKMDEVVDSAKKAVDK